MLVRLFLFAALTFSISACHRAPAPTPSAPPPTSAPPPASAASVVSAQQITFHVPGMIDRQGIT
jgi:hypothetical protein